MKGKIFMLFILFALVTSCGTTQHWGGQVYNKSIVYPNGFKSNPMKAYDKQNKKKVKKAHKKMRKGICPSA